MRRPFFRSWTGLLAVACGAGLLRAATIAVPNGSFESPATIYVSVNVDNWQKTDKPDWYDESAFLWIWNVGIFKNTAPTSPDHIDNCDGDQAAWLFNVPEVGMFQDYDSTDWNHTNALHAFDATFEPGKSYHLTVGVIGSGGNMPEGATLRISLYYRENTSNLVTVAATGITNSSAVFSNTTHLIDFTVDTAPVRPGDAWASRKIGVKMLSTIVDTNLEGGYWDLDNVRLTAVQEPVLLAPAWTNGQFQFTLRSEPGLSFEILAAPNLALPLSNWTSLATLTNATGVVSFVESPVNLSRRFYLARQLP